MSQFKIKSSLVVSAAMTLLSLPTFAASLPAECGSGTYLKLVNVKSAAELKSALTAAKAGDLIKLADGVYKGNFVAAISGTASDKITICGSRKAILDGESLKSGYTLHLKGASHMNLVGFSVTRGKNAIILDSANNNLLQGLAVYNTGNEALHLRTHSSNNIIKNNEVSNAGNYKPEYGEGIYIGSAKSNWCDYTNCNADKSDNNQIIGNKIFDTAAECIDLKEGTTNTLIQGNSFDGTGITGANYADSWIDVKGNDVVIKDNVGQNSGTIMLDGYQTHVVVDGWSQNIVFQNNKSTVKGKGYAINVDKSKNVTVYCSNTVVGADQGLSNQTCASDPVVTPPVATPAPGSGSETPVLVNTNIASMQYVISSSGFRDDHPVDRLFDGCSKETETCTAGGNSGPMMEVEFDFKKLHSIGSVKLFGDNIGNWVSESFDVEYKVQASDAYTVLAKTIPAFRNEWITQSTTGLKARYIRVRVYGNASVKSVQARELEIWGKPVDGVVVTPTPSPSPSPTVAPSPSPSPTVAPTVSPSPSPSPSPVKDIAVIALKSSSSTYPGTAVSGLKVKYYGDQSYDSFAETKLDIFTIDPSQKSKTPLVIYFHGGGFRSGDKKDSHGDAKNYLTKGVAYATVNYRMLGSAPVAGKTLLLPLNDSRRAVQFIRHYAASLNIDTNKIVLIGSSAGASTALWIGMQDDMKVASSNDPVLRQSTRVAAVGVTSTQATLDMYRWGTDPEFQGMYKQGTANGKTLLKYADTYMANTGTAFSNINQLLEEPWAAMRAKLDVINFMDSADPEIYAENTAAASDLLHTYYNVDRLYSAAVAKGVKGVFKTPVSQKALPSSQKQDSSLLNFVLRKVGL